MLETVLCVDPTDKANELSAPKNPQGGQYATHTLYQRWHFDKNRDHLPKRY